MNLNIKDPTQTKKIEWDDISYLVTLLLRKSFSFLKYSHREANSAIVFDFIREIATMLWIVLSSIMPEVIALISITFTSFDEKFKESAISLQDKLINWLMIKVLKH